MGRMHIGTSGWNYRHWRGAFYPDNLRRADWLDYYARRFESVEINASFYRLPEKDTLRAWMRRVPGDFLFALKASRYLTHMKKLKPAPEGRQRLFAAARTLGRHLGPILFQLPPNWRANPPRLDEFISSLPSGGRYAFEFRDESWWCEEVYAVLEHHGAAAVWFDLEARRSALAETADFCYLRWHGPGEKAYTGRYGRKRLRALAKTIRGWSRSGQDVYVYFDNDAAGHAPGDALTLAALLGEQHDQRDAAI